MLIRAFYIFLTALLFPLPSQGGTLKKPLVLVSVSPYKFLVRSIAGDLVDVEAVVPGPADPHSYEPTLKQVQKMRSASLWFLSGEPFENACAKAILCEAVNINDYVNVIPLAENSSCKHHKQALYDTHTWLSPKNLKKQAKLVADKLSELLPDKTAIVKANYLKIIAELDSLDEEISQVTAKATNRSILVTHPAFTYFCHDYGFRQISIEHPHKKDISPKDLVKLLQLIKSDNLSTLVFSQKSGHKKSGHLLARKLNIREIHLDPYSDDVLENLKFIAAEFSHL
ncbi:metal ABC transporter solute-binding protein, Zn/Mn family [Chlamydiifrater phoenicopteri]|uniref:metal ABC transporter solute-binding protein, Zn/Mn family n=1 Tax=Chlamydiifrater phoenicopteri TaxID=2681469 RepID=UPI001BCE04DE|nr:zinc ABC transporter substrate-binding protein [Chlamydiifrater phoenicopteri]